MKIITLAESLPLGFSTQILEAYSKRLRGSKRTAYIVLLALKAQPATNGWRDSFSKSSVILISGHKISTVHPRGRLMRARGQILPIWLQMELRGQHGATWSIPTGKTKETADFKIKKDTGYPYSLKYNILNNFASFIMYVKLQKVTDLTCPILNPIFQEILKMRSKRPTERANQLSTYTFSAKDAP